MMAAGFDQAFSALHCVRILDDAMTCFTRNRKDKHDYDHVATH